MEIEEVVQKYDQATKYRRPFMRKMVKVRRFAHHGNEVREKWIHWATTFCGYIKNKERGKKDSRAIASPNIILRNST